MAGIDVYVQYYRAPSPPPHAWHGDLARIAEMGFRGIQVRPQWRWHERQPGQFTWDDLHRLCEIATRYGLRVVVQFIVETAPAWFLKKYRPFRRDLEGRLRPPVSRGAFYVGGWEPCYDHPAVIEFASRFISAGVSALKEHDCVEAWHVWNEPRSRPGWECACQYSRKAYRNWLRRRFGTIENLNALLGKAWGSFEEVDPPADAQDYAERFLWRYWAVTRVADRVRWAAEAARKADPSRPIYSHVGFASILQDTFRDGSPDWLVARQVDRYGTSLPVRGAPIGEVDDQQWPRAVSMICDWSRSVCRDGRFHAWEIYPDQAIGVAAVPAERFEKWLWQAVAAGAEKIAIWQFRSERFGNESGDAGLVEVDGADKPHRIRAETFIRTCSRRAEFLKQLRPVEPQIFIMYDFDSHLLWDIERRVVPHGDEPDDWIVRPLPNGPRRRTLWAWYHLFRKGGYEVGWLSAQLLLENARLLPEVDRAIVLPGLCMLSDRTAGMLADWVKAGGRLLIQATTGSRLPNTWLAESAPNGPLRQLLGFEEAAYRWCSLQEARMELRPAPPDVCHNGDAADRAERRGPFVWPLAKPKGTVPEDCNVLLTYRDGTPAVISRAAGRGAVVWVGAAVDVTDEHSGAVAEMVLPVLKDALQTAPAVELSGDAEETFGTYELRLAEHPELGQFLWVLSENPGPALRLSKPQWPRAYDWLHGDEYPLAEFTPKHTALCLSPRRPDGV